MNLSRVLNKLIASTIAASLIILTPGPSCYQAAAQTFSAGRTAPTNGSGNFAPGMQTSPNLTSPATDLSFPLDQTAPTQLLPAGSLDPAAQVRTAPGGAALEPAASLAPAALPSAPAAPLGTIAEGRSVAPIRPESRQPASAAQGMVREAEEAPAEKPSTKSELQETQEELASGHDAFPLLRRLFDLGGKTGAADTGTEPELAGAPRAAQILSRAADSTAARRAFVPGLPVAARPDARPAAWSSVGLAAVLLLAIVGGSHGALPLGFLGFLGMVSTAGPSGSAAVRAKQGLTWVFFTTALFAAAGYYLAAPYLAPFLAPYIPAWASAHVPVWLAPYLSSRAVMAAAGGLLGVMASQRDTWRSFPSALWGAATSAASNTFTFWVNFGLTVANAFGDHSHDVTMESPLPYSITKYPLRAWPGVLVGYLFVPIAFVLGFAVKFVVTPFQALYRGVKQVLLEILPWIGDVIRSLRHVPAFAVGFAWGGLRAFGLSVWAGAALLARPFFSYALDKREVPPGHALRYAPTELAAAPLHLLALVVGAAAAVVGAGLGLFASVFYAPTHALQLGLEYTGTDTLLGRRLSAWARAFQAEQSRAGLPALGSYRRVSDPWSGQPLSLGSEAARFANLLGQALYLTPASALYAAVAYVRSGLRAARDPDGLNLVPIDANPKLRQVMGHFLAISRFFRPSAKEQAVREYLVQLAARRGLESVVDKAGNLLVKVPATGRFKKSKRVVALQSHLDMVLAAAQESKDPARLEELFRDGVRLVEENGWVHSKGNATSIGADNGLGVAMMMRYMTDVEAEHPALELIYTIDEERGMTGASQFDLPITAKTLLNLDSEEFGKISVGSMGGARWSVSYAPAATKVPQDYLRDTVTLSGLRGGHSGTDIHLERANSAKLLAKLIDKLAQRVPGILVTRARLGNPGMLNKIPASFELGLAFPRDQGIIVQALLDGFQRETYKSLKSDRGSEFGEIPGKVELVLERDSSWESFGLDKAAAQTLAKLLARFPDGVVKRTPGFTNEVEVSSNIGSLVLEEKGGSFSVEMGVLSRAFTDKALEDFAAQAKEAVRAVVAEAKAETFDPYPGWAPNLQSRLLRRFSQSAEKHGSFEAESAPAGLETAYFAQKFPDMEIISVGPTIRNAHTERETFEVASLSKMVDLFDEFLADAFYSIDPFLNSELDSLQPGKTALAIISIDRPDIEFASRTPRGERLEKLQELYRQNAKPVLDYLRANHVEFNELEAIGFINAQVTKEQAEHLADMPEVKGLIGNHEFSIEQPEAYAPFQPRFLVPFLLGSGGALLGFKAAQLFLLGALGLVGSPWAALVLGAAAFLGFGAGLVASRPSVFSGYLSSVWRSAVTAASSSFAFWARRGLDTDAALRDRSPRSPASPWNVLNYPLLAWPAVALGYASTAVAFPWGALQRALAVPVDAAWNAFLDMIKSIPAFFGRAIRFGAGFVAGGIEGVALTFHAGGKFVVGPFQQAAFPGDADYKYKTWPQAVSSASLQVATVLLALVVGAVNIVPSLLIGTPVTFRMALGRGYEWARVGGRRENFYKIWREELLPAELKRLESLSSADKVSFPEQRKRDGLSARQGAVRAANVLSLGLVSIASWAPLLFSAHRRSLRQARHYAARRDPSLEPEQALAKIQARLKDVPGFIALEEGRRWNVEVPFVLRFRSRAGLDAALAAGLVAREMDGYLVRFEIFDFDRVGPANRAVQEALRPLGFRSYSQGYASIAAGDGITQQVVNVRFENAEDLARARQVLPASVEGFPVQMSAWPRYLDREVQDLIDELKQIEDQTTPSIYMGPRAISVADLIREIENGTELGQEMVRLDRQVRERIDQMPASTGRVWLTAGLGLLGLAAGLLAAPWLLLPLLGWTGWAALGGYALAATAGAGTGFALSQPEVYRNYLRSMRSKARETVKTTLGFWRRAGLNYDLASRGLDEGGVTWRSWPHRVLGFPVAAVVTVGGGIVSVAWLPFKAAWKGLTDVVKAIPDFLRHAVPFVIGFLWGGLKGVAHAGAVAVTLVAAPFGSVVAPKDGDYAMDTVGQVIATRAVQAAAIVLAFSLGAVGVVISLLYGLPVTLTSALGEGLEWAEMGGRTRSFFKIWQSETLPAEWERAQALSNAGFPEQGRQLTAWQGLVRLANVSFLAAVSLASTLPLGLTLYGRSLRWAAHFAKVRDPRVDEDQAWEKIKAQLKDTPGFVSEPTYHTGEWDTPIVLTFRSQAELDAALAAGRVAWEMEGYPVSFRVYDPEKWGTAEEAIREALRRQNVSYYGMGADLRKAAEGVRELVIRVSFAAPDQLERSREILSQTYEGIRVEGTLIEGSPEAARRQAPRARPSAGRVWATAALGGLGLAAGLALAPWLVLPLLGWTGWLALGGYALAGGLGAGLGLAVSQPEVYKGYFPSILSHAVEAVQATFGVWSRTGKTYDLVLRGKTEGRATFLSSPHAVIGALLTIPAALAAGLYAAVSLPLRAAWTGLVDVIRAIPDFLRKALPFAGGFIVGGFKGLVSAFHDGGVFLANPFEWSVVRGDIVKYRMDTAPQTLAVRGVQALGFVLGAVAYVLGGILGLVLGLPVALTRAFESAFRWAGMGGRVGNFFSIWRSETYPQEEERLEELPPLGYPEQAEPTTGWQGLVRTANLAVWTMASLGTTVPLALVTYGRSAVRAARYAALRTRDISGVEYQIEQRLKDMPGFSSVRLATSGQAIEITFKSRAALEQALSQGLLSRGETEGYPVRLAVNPANAAAAKAAVFQRLKAMGIEDAAVGSSWSDEQGITRSVIRVNFQSRADMDKARSLGLGDEEIEGYPLQFAVAGVIRAQSAQPGAETASSAWPIAALGALGITAGLALGQWYLLPLLGWTGWAALGGYALAGFLGGGLGLALSQREVYRGYFPSIYSHGSEAGRTVFGFWSRAGVAYDRALRGTNAGRTFLSWPHATAGALLAVPAALAGALYAAVSVPLKAAFKAFRTFVERFLPWIKRVLDWIGRNWWRPFVFVLGLPLGFITGLAGSVLFGALLLGRPWFKYIVNEDLDTSTWGRFFSTWGLRAVASVAGVILGLTGALLGTGLAGWAFGPVWLALGALVVLPYMLTMSLSMAFQLSNMPGRRFFDLWSKGSLRVAMQRMNTITNEFKFKEERVNGRLKPADGWLRVINIFAASIAATVAGAILGLYRWGQSLWRAGRDTHAGMEIPKKADFDDLSVVPETARRFRPGWKVMALLATLGTLGLSAGFWYLAGLNIGYWALLGLLAAPLGWAIAALVGLGAGLVAWLANQLAKEPPQAAARQR